MADMQVRQFFQTWYSSGLGARVLATEIHFLEQRTADLVGYYMVVQSPLTKFKLKGNRIRHQILLAPQLELGAPKHTVVGMANELPIESDGVDVHVLHHTLDLSTTPHDDLREAARTLLPSGKVFIVGFNPWSFWGARKLLSKGKVAPWNAHFIAPRRLADWLKVAGLTLESIDFLLYRPPLKNPLWCQWYKKVDVLLRPTKLPLGGIYVITATKQTRCHIANKPRWRSVPVRVTTLTKPTIKEMPE